MFEVNSTSVRSRPNILAILREATLSHQVTTTHPHNSGSTKSGDIASFFSKPTSSSSVPVPRITGEKKTTSAKPSGICAFFKPKQSQKGGPESKDRDGENDEGSVQLKAKRKKRQSRIDSTIIIGSSSEGELVAPTEHAQSGASVALATATVILLEEVDLTVNPIAVLGTQKIGCLLSCLRTCFVAAGRWTFSLRRSEGSGPLCTSLLPPPSVPLS